MIDERSLEEQRIVENRLHEAECLEQPYREQRGRHKPLYGENRPANA